MTPASGGRAGPEKGSGADPGAGMAPHRQGRAGRNHPDPSTDGHELEVALGRAGASWCAQVSELARADPGAADRLYHAMWATMMQVRPESPVSLSERIAPTESVPTKPPGSRDG